MVYENDVHAKISRTHVRQVIKIRSLQELTRTVEQCRRNGWKISIAGGRHSLGRQPFATNGVVLDLRAFNKVKSIDVSKGVLCLEGGCRWTDIRKYLHEKKQTEARQWEIHQKQTGADSISIAGSIAVNAHGNGLQCGPISSDILWLKVVTQDGSEVFCDRKINSELFSLVIGGFGLFGVISEIGLQLVPAQTFLRHSAICEATEAISLWSRGSHSYEYGDMQLNLDPSSEGYLRTGILNLREPIQSAVASQQAQRPDWNELLALTHFDKSKAFEAYCTYASRVNGSHETRESFLWDFYEEDYHSKLEANYGLPPSGDILAEFFIPAEQSECLLASAITESKLLNINFVLATLRSIRKCEVSYLRWAKRDYMCLVVAMHTEHTEESLIRTDAFCKKLCETCCQHSGSFYLPYRSFYSRQNLLDAYPNFDDFEAKKTQYDPAEVFSSDWFDKNRASVFS